MKAPISVAEAARRLERSTRYVHYLVEQGVLPERRLGREAYFLEGDLDPLLAARRGPGRPRKSPDAGVLDVVVSASIAREEVDRGATVLAMRVAAVWRAVVVSPPLTDRATKALADGFHALVGGRMDRRDLAALGVAVREVVEAGVLRRGGLAIRQAGKWNILKGVDGHDGD